jgi:hypothetical protein
LIELDVLDENLMAGNGMILDENKSGPEYWMFFSMKDINGALVSDL